MEKEIRQEEFYSIVRDNKKDYAQATFQRAFPHHKDGFKSVIRRIIFAMFDMKIFTKTVKSSNVVGEVMGKYHPHGDASIYEAIVKLTEPFSNNCPLVTGQGNFGSVNGDRAAAPRYTECRLSNFAQDAIEQSHKSIVDYEYNYDNSREIAKYLSIKIPILLLNGTMGIGEAYVSGLPPHNISDVVDVCIKYIRNKNISNIDLVDGLYPDLPNYGIIINKSEIEQYYKYGTPCTLKVKSTVDIDRENKRIFVRDLPYGITKDTIMEKITKKNEEKHVVMSKILNMLDIKTIREGELHYEYEIKYDHDSSNLLEIVNELTKTCLTNSIMLNFMLYYDDMVKSVTIRDIIEEWYNMRCSSIKRRLNYELTTKNNRKHILDGILSIYDNIDDVIKYIKTSESQKDVISYLMNTYSLSMVQSKHISEMQLYKLSRVSKDDLIKNIENLVQSIIETENELFRIDDIMIDDLLYLKNKYQRARRSLVIDENNESGGDIVISSGAVINSHNQFSIFDMENLANGKAILNGMKAVKIDGKKTKEIIGVHEITNNVIGLFLIFENGTAKRIETSEIKYINNWINIDSQVHVKYVLPIYSPEDKIIELTDDLKIKYVNPSIFTKLVSNHNNIVNCKNVHEDDEVVFICNSKDEYVAYYMNDIPETTGRVAQGNKTAFNDNTINYFIETFNLTSKETLIFTIKDNENNTFMISRELSDISIVGRPGKIKKLLDIDLDEFEIIGVDKVKTYKKDTKCLMIGKFSTSQLKINNFKYISDEPKKITIDPKCIIQF